MGDILDQIAQQQTADENAGIAQARANNTWAQTFSSIPPVEKLRASRNLTDQIATAMERRQALAAQTDRNAQEIYFNAQKHQQFMADEPKRMELLQSQIDHQNALSDAEHARKLRATQEETLANEREAQVNMAHVEFNKIMNSNLSATQRLEKLREIPASYPAAGNNTGFREVFNPAMAQAGKELEPATPPTQFQQFEMDRARKALTPAQKVQAEAEANTAFVENRIAQSPKVTYGHLENGNVVPDTGGAQATHAKVVWTDKDGRTQNTEIMPIDEYSAIKTRNAARTQPNAPTEKPATDTVEMGGHHYEVDHAAKKVLRQID